MTIQGGFGDLKKKYIYSLRTGQSGFQLMYTRQNQGRTRFTDHWPMVSSYCSHLENFDIKKIEIGQIPKYQICKNNV